MKVLFRSLEIFTNTLITKTRYQRTKSNVISLYEKFNVDVENLIGVELALFENRKTAFFMQSGEIWNFNLFSSPPYRQRPDSLQENQGTLWAIGFRFITELLVLWCELWKGRCWRTKIVKPKITIKNNHFRVIFDLLDDIIKNGGSKTSTPTHY